MNVCDIYLILHHILKKREKDYNLVIITVIKFFYMNLQWRKVFPCWQLKIEVILINFQLQFTIISTYLMQLYYV